MKTLYPELCVKSLIRRAFSLLIAGCMIVSGTKAQTAANWNFNNTLAASNGAHLSSVDITLGTSVTSNAFNAGTEFFGQDGWPAGALDPNAYVQFTVTAGSGYYMVLNTVTLVIRHSTLGTAAGSGPGSWSLRSSLDGYTADIATGSLTTSYQTIPVTLPATFHSIASTVTFRVYGYNETTTTGGLNRFVFDNISITGQANAGTLAERTISLTAKNAGTGVVGLQWQAMGFPDRTDLIVERSVDGTGFTAIDQQTSSSGVEAYQYRDGSVSSNTSFYYRIRAVQPDGAVTYSAIAAVTAEPMSAGSLSIRGAVAQGAAIKALVEVGTAGTYQLSIWSMDGKAVYRQMINGQAGNNTADISFGGYPHGVYVLTLSKDGVNSSRQFMY
jgi:hypothetical protein